MGAVSFPLPVLVFAPALPSRLVADALSGMVHIDLLLLGPVPPSLL
jgi:hypothetical protein